MGEKLTRKRDGTIVTIVKHFTDANKGACTCCAVVHSQFLGGYGELLSADERFEVEACIDGEIIYSKEYRDELTTLHEEHQPTTVTNNNST